MDGIRKNFGFGCMPMLNARQIRVHRPRRQGLRIHQVWQLRAGLPRHLEICRLPEEVAAEFEKKEA